MKVLLLVIIYCILNSCSNANKVKTDNPIGDEEVLLNDLHDDNTKERNNQIIYIDDTIYKGDTLLIKFKVPHNKDLAIEGPDTNQYYFLSLDSLIIPSYELFSKQESLQIITDKTKSIPFVFGATKRELIFKNSGTYKIQLSQNLETEDLPIEMVQVVYFNSER